MPVFLSYLSPSVPQLLGLGAVLLIVTGFIAIGRAAAQRGPLPEMQLIAGWAVVIAIFTVAGTLGLQTFSVLATGVAAVAVLFAIWAVRRDGRLGPAGWWRVLVLAAPLLALAAAMTPTQWDELTNWLPNARFLTEYDTFPNSDLPRNPSVYPAYPYGLPFVIYFASQLTGQFVENAAALFNLLLYLSFGLFLVRLSAALIKKDGTAVGQATIGWGLCALAGLLVTALNPTYVSRLVLSSYADAPTGITVGFACALTWMMLNALARGEREAARSCAWMIGLAMTAAIGLKQVNLVFLIFLCLAALWIAARDPAIGWRSVCKLGPYAIALPLIVYGAWRLHVGLHLSGGEFSLRPFSEWYVAIIPDVVARMALVASKKGGYFGIMILASLLALRVVWRPRSDYDRLTVLAAVLFLAYNAFLLLTYIAAFSKMDALRAGSYWRYNTHLGGVCLLFATYSVALLWRRYLSRPVHKAVPAVVVILVIALPIAMGKKLRFDLDPGYGFARSTAADISRILTAEDRLLLVDPLEDGGYLVIMRFHLHGSAEIAGHINAWNPASPEQFRRTVASTRASHAWIFSAEPGVTTALGLTLSPGKSYLLARKGASWSVVRDWPHPPPRYASKAPTEAR